jgi:hypothetical protein
MTLDFCTLKGMDVETYVACVFDMPEDDPTDGHADSVTRRLSRCL